MNNRKSPVAQSALDEEALLFHAASRPGKIKIVSSKPMAPQRLQRQGYLERDCQRMINQNRNIFSALLLDMGLADAAITGTTRHFRQALQDINPVIGAKDGKVPAGIHKVVGRSRTVFIADTTVHECPDAETPAMIAAQVARFARSMDREPKVAFLSYSNFGNPQGSWLAGIREAIALLDKRKVDFEYEGEITPDVAMNPAMRRLYPFNRLSGPANVLIMPGLQSANITAKLMKETSGHAIIGPILVGMEKPVQIAAMTASAADLGTLAMLASAGMAS